MKRLTSSLFSALGCLTFAQAVSAGNITDINVSTLPNDQKIIKIKFDRDILLPSGFATTTPARIALDFTNTGTTVPQPVLEYADPLLSQITVAQNQDRTRVLLSLNHSSQYNTEIKGDEVWVYVNEVADRTVAHSNSAPIIESHTINTSSTAQPHLQTALTPAPAAYASIDFRASRNRSGIIELRTPGFNGEPQIKQLNDRINIILKNYPLPAAQQRSLDVNDFATPVRNITLKRVGNDTQLTIRNHGNWHLQTHTSNGYTSFEVSPKNNHLASQGLSNINKSFKGRRITLDFQNMDVRTILQILSKESGMNIVASDSVTGKMTLNLNNVPWDQALDLVLEARNLDQRRQGNIIMVAPKEELLAKDKASLQAQKEIEDLGSLYSQTFQLKYKNVEEFRKILRLDERSSNNSDGQNSILSTRGSALTDPATNTLIITDNRRVIQKFQKLVDELDVPAQQVMVEARIVEAEDGFARDLGVKFGFYRTNNRSSWGGNLNQALDNTVTLANRNRAIYNNAINGDRSIPELSPFSFSPNINLPVSAASSSIALVRSIASGALGLELSAMQEENKGRIISNPRVLTQNRKEAVIESGTEIPYEQSTSSGATSISFKKAVLGLTVTPNITPDGHIIMNIKINKDNPTECRASGLDTLCISTKKLDTSAMVEDGGTLIVGGIYEEENTNGVNKVPLLGDIPVVGNLFKSRNRKQTRRELLIFITPRIVDNRGSRLLY